jgi:hypothetical protein
VIVPDGRPRFGDLVVLFVLGGLATLIVSALNAETYIGTDGIRKLDIQLPMLLIQIITANLLCFGRQRGVPIPSRILISAVNYLGALVMAIWLQTF